MDYYNDSKATNVAAAVKAVESFDSGVWIILGGRDKDGDFGALMKAMRGRVETALLIGEAAGKIRSQLNGDFPARDCGQMRSALAFARGAARPGDTVLLAPACASFDMYADYEARGDAFAAEVRRVLGR